MKNSKINGYKLTRDWFEWCKHNPEKIRPIHTAIYIYAVETSNRLGWVEKFGFPTRYVMQVLGISDWRTYNKAINDLIDFGFLKLIRKSQNQYQSAIIAIVKNTKALHYHNSITTLSHTESQQDQSNITTVINKPNKPLNNKTKKREKQIILALDFLNFNFPERIKLFNDEFGNRIQNKEAFKKKFNNKMIEQNVNLETTGEDVLFAKLENYAISWIGNQKNTVTENNSTSRPNYF